MFDTNTPFFISVTFFSEGFVANADIFLSRVDLKTGRFFSMFEENEGRFFSMLEEKDGRFFFMFDEKEGAACPSDDGKEDFCGVISLILFSKLDGKEDCNWNDGFFLSRLNGNEFIFLSLLDSNFSRLDSNDGKLIDGGDGKGRLAFLRNFFGGNLDGVGDGEGGI